MTPLLPRPPLPLPLTPCPNQITRVGGEDAMLFRLLQGLDDDAWSLMMTSSPLVKEQREEDDDNYQDFHNDGHNKFGTRGPGQHG